MGLRERLYLGRYGLPRRIKYRKRSHVKVKGKITKIVENSSVFVENAGKPPGDRPGHRYSNSRCWIAVTSIGGRGRILR